MIAAVKDVAIEENIELPRDRRPFMVNDLDSSRMQEFLDGFSETLNAMKKLGFTNSQRKDIFFVLHLLIHMADIRFVQEDDYCRIDTDDQRT